ncbi:hypothetical protein C5688_08690 [Methylocystis sp. MitZ-2018]|nr:hypothetical protein C5688_08690 [Methylocystis sp. MitZ-2018]
MTPLPYALPLLISKGVESFVVEGAISDAPAYVYFEEEPRRRSFVNRLSGADAKSVAQLIAPTLTAGS